LTKIWFSIDVKIQEKFLCPHSTKVLFARFCVKEHLFTQDLDFSCDIVEDSRKDVVITSFLIFVLVSYSWNHQLLLFIFIDGFEKVDDFSFHDFFRDIMLMINFVVFLDAVCFT